MRRILLLLGAAVLLCIAWATDVQAMPDICSNLEFQCSQQCANWGCAGYNFTCDDSDPFGTAYCGCTQCPF